VNKPILKVRGNRFKQADKLNNPEHFIASKERLLAAAQLVLSKLKALLQRVAP
jgi:hypothetical protein